MGALAASGGYYVAVPGSPIFAERTTMTGSIGVYAAFPNLKQMSDKIGFSQRTFIQRFSEAVGLTPKTFCRMHRFQRVLKLIHDAREVDWTDVSLSCGYFDQAHFIHDFRAFAGINPTTYMLHKTEHLNHVPLVE